MRKITLAAAFFALASYAHAQGTFPLNNVPIGKGPGKTGFTAVPPGAENSCLMIIAGIPTFQTCPGAGTGGSVTTLNAGDGITLTPNPTTTVGSIKVTTGAANTIKGSINGTTTSDLAITACSTIYGITQWIAGTGWSCGINPVLPSRATAATLNLSAFSSIQTQGYASGGDGGNAYFKKIAAGTAFIDSYITTYTITGGSGFTNGGPYNGVIWSGPGGQFAIGTATVSGGAITAINIAGTPSTKCKVGDVYTLSGSAAVVGGAANGMPAGGTGNSFTVTGCSTPLASFTDSASNKWQYVPDGMINVRQFGCKGDWDGSDGGATDDFACLQAAFWYGSNKTSTSYDSGGWWGNRVLVPQGTYMFGCGSSTSLIIPHGVQVWGVGGTASDLHSCGTFNGTTVLIELGDPSWHFSCFQSSLWHIAVSSQGGGTAYAVHSNCGQDFSGIYYTYFFMNGSSRRPCAHYEAGFGGASWWGVINTSCNAKSNSAMFRSGNTAASGLNLGNTMVEWRNIVMGGPSAGPDLQTATGILLNGGNNTVVNAHSESMVSVVEVTVPVTANNEMQWLQNLNGGGGAIACTGVVVLTGTNNPGNTVFTQFPSQGSCGNTITNGQAGGVNFNGVISKPITCVAGACS